MVNSMRDKWFKQFVNPTKKCVSNPKYKAL